MLMLIMVYKENANIFDEKKNVQKSKEDTTHTRMFLLVISKQVATHYFS